MGKGPFAYPIPPWLLGPLALCAGCAAMILVLLQAAGFAYLYGFGVETQTTVLATFVGGFALGAVIVGLRSDGSQHPLRWFGVLQVGLGFFAFGAPTIAGLLGEAPSLALMATAMLLLPGMLTGGGAVLLVRAGAHTTERGALALGSVSAAQALGAALAFPILAVASTGTMAAVGASLQVLVGTLAWGLSVPTGKREIFAMDDEAPRPRWVGDAGPAVLMALIVAGAALPLQRFAWNRLLPFALDTADPAATGFLLHMMGISLGALMATLLLSGGHNARRLLARVLLASSILIGAPLFYGDAMLQGGGLGSAAALVLPGAFGVGMILPLVAHVALSDRNAVGKQTGALIGLFGIGWAVGLAFIVPSLLEAQDSRSMIVACAAAVLVSGTIVGFGRGLREWIPAGTATLVVVLVVIGGTRTEALASRMSAVHAPDAPRRVIEERQSATATYAVVENLRDGTRRLYRNGLTGAPAGRYEIGYRLLGHLPALLHPLARRALVARFGTGTAAGALAQHPQMEEIHAVAEEEAVFDLAPAFAEQNRRIAANKLFKPSVSPLRPYLRSHTSAFDIITLEPPAADSVRGRLLHTSEFYALARGALREGGLLCQRLPTETYGPGVLKQVVAAANRHFEFVTLWDFADGLFLLASSNAPVLEAQALILSFSKVGADLQQARIGDALHLLASSVCTGPGFAPKAAHEPLQDTSEVEVEAGASAKLRAMVAAASSADGAAWAGQIYDGLDAAIGRAQELRQLRAKDGISSEKLFQLASSDRGDLRARSAAEEKLYQERMDRREFGGAARLSLVRDRSTALIAMISELEGDRRTYYAILLLRSGVAANADDLDQLAAELEGKQQRYVQNRARALRGESALEGDEKLPDVALRDPTAALEAWDEEQLRLDVLDSECANHEHEFDALILKWLDRSTDQRRAILLLHAVGWRQTIRAARKLAGKGSRNDLMALAPLFAAAYPEDRTWKRLCGDDSPRVRAAAAEAARANGGPAHVPELLLLCEDPAPGVRTGAFHSLEGILGDAVGETGYDPAEPTPEALEKLRKLR